MTRIESLTDAQKAKFKKYVKKWTDIGLSTKPANRRQAEIGIRKAYKSAGLEAPKIIWTSSPMGNALTRSICQKITKEEAEKILGASVGASVRASVGDSVWDSVGDSVGASVRASVWDSVGASVRASVWASVWASVRDSVGASVWASVGASVGASVWASVGASVGDSVWDSGYGQHDANWIGFYDYFRQELGLKSQTEKLQGLTQITKNSGWFLPHEKICWVCERHSVLKTDERGRLHSTNGPALQYPDGWGIYAIHGVRVPEFVIVNPEKITAEVIKKETNAEIRRVMINRYIGGAEQWMRDSGAELVNHDQYGKLWRKDRPGDTPIDMIEVVNGTQEPDGTFKTYWLRVKPGFGTCKEAVAWTYDVDPKNYKPEVRT